MSNYPGTLIKDASIRDEIENCLRGALDELTVQGVHEAFRDVFFSRHEIKKQKPAYSTVIMVNKKGPVLYQALMNLYGDVKGLPAVYSEYFLDCKEAAQLAAKTKDSKDDMWALWDDSIRGARSMQRLHNNVINMGVPKEQIDAHAVYAYDDPSMFKNVSNLRLKYKVKGDIDTLNIFSYQMLSLFARCEQPYIVDNPISYAIEYSDGDYESPLYKELTENNYKEIKEIPALSKNHVRLYTRCFTGDELAKHLGFENIKWSSADAAVDIYHYRQSGGAVIVPRISFDFVSKMQIGCFLSTVLDALSADKKVKEKLLDEKDVTQYRILRYLLAYILYMKVVDSKLCEEAGIDCAMFRYHFGKYADTIPFANITKNISLKSFNGINEFCAVPEGFTDAEDKIEKDQIPFAHIFRWDTNRNRILLFKEKEHYFNINRSEYELRERCKHTLRGFKNPSSSFNTTLSRLVKNGEAVERINTYGETHFAEFLRAGEVAWYNAMSYNPIFVLLDTLFNQRNGCNEWDKHTDRWRAYKAIGKRFVALCDVWPKPFIKELDRFMEEIKMNTDPTYVYVLDKERHTIIKQLYSTRENNVLSEAMRKRLTKYYKELTNNL